MYLDWLDCCVWQEFKRLRDERSTGEHDAETQRQSLYTENIANWMHSLRPLAFLKETVHPKTIALTSISMLAITAGPMSSHWWNDDWISSKAWWLIKWDVIASAAVCLLLSRAAALYLSFRQTARHVVFRVLSVIRISWMSRSETQMPSRTEACTSWPIQVCNTRTSRS